MNNAPVVIPYQIKMNSVKRVNANKKKIRKKKLHIFTFYQSIHGLLQEKKKIDENFLWLTDNTAATTATTTKSYLISKMQTI